MTVNRWLQRGVDWLYAFQEAPLLYMLLYLVSLALGGQVVLALKILGPVLYGLFGCAMFIFTRSSLKWDITKSFFVSALILVQIGSLRVGWDLWRNVLGLIFYLLLVSLISKKASKSILASLALLVVLSNQFAAVLLIGTVIALSFGRHGEISKPTWLFPASFLFLANFLMVIFAKFQPRPNMISLLDVRTHVINYIEIFGSYSEIFLEFLSLASYSLHSLVPLSMLGIFSNPIVASMFVVSMAGSLWFIALPWSAFSQWWRWVLLLVYPLALYAGNGLDNFLETALRGMKHRSFLKSVSWGGIILAYLCLSGFYLTAPQAKAVSFGDLRANRYLPPTMVMLSVNSTDIQPINRALGWVNERMDSSSILLVEERFFAWTDHTIDSRNWVLVYPVFWPHGPALETARGQGFETIFLLWLSNRTLTGFDQVYRSGNIAVYKYHG